MAVPTLIYNPGSQSVSVPGTPVPNTVYWTSTQVYLPAGSFCVLTQDTSGLIPYVTVSSLQYSYDGVNYFGGGSGGASNGVPAQLGSFATACLFFRIGFTNTSGEFGPSQSATVTFVPKVYAL